MKYYPFVFLLISCNLCIMSCSTNLQKEEPGAPQSIFETNWTSDYFGYPTDIFVDQNNWIYVIDQSADAVRIFDDNCSYQTGWTNNSLNSPFGITVNPNRDKIYVADTWNQRIVVYTYSGFLITNINIGANVFDILVDINDNIYVLAGSSLYKYNSNYSLAANANVGGGYGLVFDGYGRICSLINGLSKYDTNTLGLVENFSWNWAGNYAPLVGCDLAISPDKTKLFGVNHPADIYSSSYIEIYNTNGTFLSNIYVTYIEKEGLFLSANTAIACNSSGKIYLMAYDYNNSKWRLYKFK